MNKLIAAVPMVAAAAVLSATPAVADVAYMTGLFGATVDYASINAPAGQGCDPGAGCDLIPYANFSVNAASLRLPPMPPVGAMAMQLRPTDNGHSAPSAIMAARYAFEAASM